MPGTVVDGDVYELDLDSSAGERLDGAAAFRVSRFDVDHGHPMSFADLRRCEVLGAAASELVPAHYRYLGSGFTVIRGRA